MMTSLILLTSAFWPTHQRFSSGDTSAIKKLVNPEPQIGLNWLIPHCLVTELNVESGVKIESQNQSFSVMLNENLTYQRTFPAHIIALGGCQMCLKIPKTPETVQLRNYVT